MFPEAKGEENIEPVKEKQNSLFPVEPVIKCFVIPPNSKLEKPVKKLFTLAGSQICCDFDESNLITFE